jgi:hypothetical protein
MIEHDRDPAQLRQFREINPIPQWSAGFPVDVPYEDFLRTTLTTAAKTGHRYKGILTLHPDTRNVTSFTHTRLPRNKYGQPPTIEACETGMHVLAERLGTTSRREALAPGMSRIVLGLYEGQHATGSRNEPQGPDYSIADVSQALGHNFDVRSGQVLSTRSDPNGDVSYYAEDVATIVFPTIQKTAAYLLGHTMRQERFSVEDFGEPQGISYMVETMWCQEPDPLEPVEAS